MNWVNGFISWVWGFFYTPKEPDSVEVTAIQAAAVRACGFLPMAETVGALLAQSNPSIVPVSAIATQICAMVTKSKPPNSPITLMGMGLMESPQPLNYGQINGVPIHGVFVK